MPTAHPYGRSHEILACFAGAMAVMAASLLILKSAAARVS
jgi:hypothetical protein